MNKHLSKYLTHESKLLREWVKERISRTDQIYVVIEGDIGYIPGENVYVYGEVIVWNKELKSLNVKVLYCKYLSCWNNQLTKLPELPVCKYLSCWNNQLTKLPELPVCEGLSCENNQLKSLPKLPVCGVLYCQNNPGYPFK